MKKYSFVLLSAVFVFAVAGCKITGSDTIPVAAYRVVNASPDAPHLDVYANSIASATNIAYDSSTGYIVTSAGNYQIRVAPTGTSNFLIDATINFEAGKTYSIYTIDSLSKIKAVATLDQFTKPSADSVKVRFFHFSTNTGIIDLAVTDSTGALFSNRTFNDQFLSPTYSDYIMLPAAMYNLEIRQSGAPGPVVILALPNIILSGGKVYTIYAKGFTGGVGTQAFGVKVLTDYP